MRNIVWIALLALILLAMFNTIQPQNSGYVEKDYSDFMHDVKTKQIQSVTIVDKFLVVTATDDTIYKVNTTGNPALADSLVEQGIQVSVYPEPKASLLSSILINVLPMLLLIGVWIYFMRKMQPGSGAGGFGTSKAKLLHQNYNKITFSDVAGCDEAKQEVLEIVDFLRNPGKFQKTGGKIPTGILLVGSPGCGKTLLARAIAGEADVPFFSTSGSDFVEMFVGVGAARVRDMFNQAKQKAPCIVFIDEIDAVGRQRGAGLGGGHDEREQTLNSILVEMDGFEQNEGIIIVAATNRPDVLDSALLRPGRFDRQVIVPNPDLLGREQILKVHLKKINLGPNWSDINIKVLARKTPGMSGADLANLVNEAALAAGRKNRSFVVMEDFEYASDKIIMGLERRNAVLTEQDKKLIAYHEAGHALVGLNCEYHDPLHKITIIPRGRAMGVTVSLPEKDRWGWSKQELLDRLASLYGGREAERMVFGEEHITTGAGHDIQQATNIARAMVKEYGMGSDELGRIRYESNAQEIFLGRSVSQSINISQKYTQLVDDEIKKITQSAEMRARTILTEKKDQLDKIVEALLIYETLSGEDVQKILNGEIITKSEEAMSTPETGQSKPKCPAKISSVPSVTLKT